MDADLKVALGRGLLAEGRVMVVTGAGISAESGVPTFRGPEGFWTPGSDLYTPEEFSTAAFFADHPDQVWAFNLWRNRLLAAARPNAAHLALAALEEALGDRFLLVTQNVDGLHHAAGNRRVIEGHGHSRSMRCTRPCTAERFPIPAGMETGSRDRPLSDADRARLVCPRCGAMTRPHELWFDEPYDEELYGYDTARRAAAEASVLVMIGTSGATLLPHDLFAPAALNGATVVDVNPQSNPFRLLADRIDNGFWIDAPATRAVPPLIGWMLELATGD